MLILSHGPYKAVPVLLFGTLQLIFGSGLILLDVISFGLEGFEGFVLSAFASGFWTGIFHIICGCFGVTAGKPLHDGEPVSNRKCPLTTTFVISILSSISTFGLSIIFGVYLPIWGYTTHYSGYCDYKFLSCWERHRSEPAYSLIATYLAFNIILFFVVLGQAVATGMNLCKLPGRQTVTYISNNPQVVYSPEVEHGLSVYRQTIHPPPPPYYGAVDSYHRHESYLPEPPEKF